jgi:non-ribosomal peptide synthetase component E (peptide arylation enzyme)
VIFFKKGGRTKMNIGSLLSQNARKFPEVLAIECEGRSYTYRQFNEEVNRLAHGLLKLGINRAIKLH